MSTSNVVSKVKPEFRLNIFEYLVDPWSVIRLHLRFKHEDIWIKFSFGMNPNLKAISDKRTLILQYIIRQTPGPIQKFLNLHHLSLKYIFFKYLNIPILIYI